MLTVDVQVWTASQAMGRTFGRCFEFFSHCGDEKGNKVAATPLRVSSFTKNKLKTLCTSQGWGRKRYNLVREW